MRAKENKLEEKEQKQQQQQKPTFKTQTRLKLRHFRLCQAPNKLVCAHIKQ